MMMMMPTTDLTRNPISKCVNMNAYIASLSLAGLDLKMPYAFVNEYFFGGDLLLIKNEKGSGVFYHKCLI